MAPESHGIQGKDQGDTASGKTRELRKSAGPGARIDGAHDWRRGSRRVSGSFAAQGLLLEALYLGEGRVVQLRVPVHRRNTDHAATKFRNVALGNPCARREFR